MNRGTGTTAQRTLLGGFNNNNRISSLPARMFSTGTTDQEKAIIYAHKSPTERTLKAVKSVDPTLAKYIGLIEHPEKDTDCIWDLTYLEAASSSDWAKILNDISGEPTEYLQYPRHTLANVCSLMREVFRIAGNSGLHGVISKAEDLSAKFDELYKQSLHDDTH